MEFEEFRKVMRKGRNFPDLGDVCQEINDNLSTLFETLKSEGIELTPETVRGYAEAFSKGYESGREAGHRSGKVAGLYATSDPY